MRKNNFHKSVAMLLILLMLVAMIPNSVFANNDRMLFVSRTTESVSDSSLEEADNVAASRDDDRENPPETSPEETDPPEDVKEVEEPVVEPAETEAPDDSVIGTDEPAATESASDKDPDPTTQPSEPAVEETTAPDEEPDPTARPTETSVKETVAPVENPEPTAEPSEPTVKATEVPVEETDEPGYTDIIAPDDTRSAGQLLHESNGVQVYKNYLSAQTGQFYALYPALYFTTTPICWPYKCYPLSGGSTMIGAGRVGLSTAVPEVYFVNGEIAYCFDRGTPARVGTYVQSSSISEADIPTTEAKALTAARVAKVLTDNDYAVLRAGVNRFVRSSAILTNVNFITNGNDVSPSTWKSYIRESDDLCYCMVQMIVWNIMNDGTWLKYHSSVGGYDSQNPYHTYKTTETGSWVDPKTGEVHQGGDFPATVSIGAFIDFEEIYEYALDYLEEHDTQSEYSRQWEQTIKPGETIELTNAQGGWDVWCIYKNDGFYGSASDLTLRRADHITYITASANATPAQYGWQEITRINEAIYSSKPYQEGTEGQFIVNETVIRRVRSRIKIEQGGGYLSAKKVSANPGITNGNSCYSLAGIVFKVYTNQACTNEVTVDAAGNPFTLVTNAQGVTNAVQLDLGTYWIRETQASVAGTGFGYNPTPVSVTISGSNSTPAMAAVATIANNPLGDPIALYLRKKDATTSDGSPAGNLALSGAQYTFWYYTGFNAQGSPERTWVFATDENGFIFFDTATPLAGSSEFYVDENGNRIIPIGSLKIKETLAPAGYALDQTEYVFNFAIDENGAVHSDGGGIIGENGAESLNIISEEQPGVFGSIKVTKVDSATGNPYQGDASVEGIRFAVVNDSENAIIYKGTSYAPGKVIDILTLNSNGTAATDASSLPYGAYSVYELRVDATIQIGQTYAGSLLLGDSVYANDNGYKYEDNHATLNVVEDGVEYNCSFSNPVVTGGGNIVKKDSETNSTTSQGGASLADIEYAIVNRSANAVVVDNVVYESGKIVMIVSTNADGRFTMTGNLLPYGNYDVIELRYGHSAIVGATYSANLQGDSEYANAHGYLWRAQTKTVTIRTNGQTVSVDFSDPVVRGGVKFGKVDAATGLSQGTGDSTLEGAKIAIFNNSDKAVIVDNMTYEPGSQVMILATDANGNCATSNTALPYGSYYAIEIEPPVGYSLNSEWRVDFVIREQGKIIDTTSIDDKVTEAESETMSGWAAVTGGYSDTAKLADSAASGRFSITKRDAEIDGPGVQGNASMAGIEFAVINRSSGSIKIGRDTIDPGCIAMIIELNANGSYISASNALPYGSYEIVELRYNHTAVVGAEYSDNLQGNSVYANETGYLWNEFHEAFTIHGENANVALTCSDPVVRGGVKFQKVDAETSENVPQGLASLEGAEITIYNNSENAIIINGIAYQPGKAIIVLVTNASGYCSTNADMLPFGSYYAIETKAPNGYVLNDGWRSDFTIEEQGVIVDATPTDAAMLRDSIIRADLTFYKEDVDGNPMGNIPFLVSLIDNEGNILESHVIVTDANGYVNTAMRSKTDNKVNSMDQYVVNGVFTNENMMDSTANIWFGDYSSRSDDKGSMVYGYYVVTELRCSVNAGHDMLTQLLFDLDADLDEVFVNGENYTLRETFVNLVVHPDSELIDNASGSHTASIGEAVNVTDTFYYDNLKTYRTYKLETEIVYVSRDGNTVTSLGSNIVTFQPESVDTTDIAYGTVDNTVTVNTTGLYGGTLHAIDKLYAVMDGEEVLMLVHNEDMNIESQSLQIPYMITIARDSETEDHVGTISSTAVIIDHIVYENLAVGHLYEFTGLLKDAETGETVAGPVTMTLHISESSTDVTEVGGIAFGPSNGEFDMPPFTFDASGLGGKTLVVTETLRDYENDITLIEHNDLDDESQSIHYIEITTEAADEVTGTHTAIVGTTVITDRVTLENTIPGQTYVVNGTLVYQADCVDANGVEHHQGDILAVHEPVTVVAEDTTTVVMISFEVDASALEGISGVVFEDVTHNNVVVATHYDYEALSQTPQWPMVRTQAVAGETNGSTGAVCEETTIVDRVTLTNLVIGDTYKVSGKLMNQEDGSVFMSNGAPVTAESDEFTATASEMAVDLTFTFNSADLGGKSLVVFEKLYCVSVKGTNEVACHEDINDENQTIDYPSIETNANDGQTGDEVGTVGETETIIDTVTYHNLVVGEEYTITGTLHYLEDYTDINGDFHEAGDVVMDGEEPITASVTFVAETEDGSIDLVYTVNTELLRGSSVVVFEDLYYNNALVYSHADLNDENQRVDYPEISTSAKDADTEDHVGSTGVATIVDVVTLTNLTVGKTYTVSGVLMDKATGEPLLDKDGNAITATYGPFEAEAANMTVELEFTVDVENSENLTAVAFETLIHNDVIVSAHEDIEDEEQTVHFPKIRTTAEALDTEDHVTGANDKVTITDVVKYENLMTDGREYTIEGYLVDKSNGGAILIDGERITASITFVPEEPDGEVELVFTFDGSALAGTTIVAYETLYYNEIEVAVHADINDDNQTVYIPRVWTNAFDADTLLDHSLADEEVTVIDVVSYSNLLPGKEYTVRGILMNKETGEPIIVNGEEVISELTFTPEEENGEIQMTFTFDATDVAGTPVVVFERLYYNDVEVAAHADLDDENQTDYIPSISTTAIADDTEDHVTGAHEIVTIIDTVYYNGLKPNSKYEISGILMDKAANAPLLDAEGNEITANVTFVTGDLEEGQVGVSGSVDLEFTFDASLLAGTTVVAFETMYHEDKVVAVHTDINDEDQSVYIPEIWTTAKADDTHDHVTAADNEIVVTDLVQYTNLLPGKEYTVKGILMNKATGEPVLVNGEEVTAETNFIPETPDGEVELTFVFDGTDLAGTTVVAFETMYYNEIEVAVHADIEDDNQTVYIPAISTSATADDTNDHITQARETITITDVVSYTNLLPGVTYTVSGILMDKTTGEPVVINDEYVTATAEFVPEEPDGEVEIQFVFDGSGLKPRTLVAFETLYLDDVVVAVHADIDDEEQTVYIPEIYTTAKDVATGGHEGHCSTEVTVEDEVFYTNLIPGKTYTVEGTLMVKETGEPLMINGEPVTASKTFVPEEPDGSVILTFVFDSTALAGTTVVAFEDLQYEGVTIAVHADINDADQSVTFPEIRTNAYDKSTGKQNMSIGNSVILADRITYTGLTPGREYVVKGEVMDKSTGRSIGVTAEMRFTPENADGEVIMEFVLNTYNLKGKTLVVFEKLYDTEGLLIAEHSDINDAAQTVKVPNTPKTGDTNNVILWIVLMALSLVAVGAVLAVVIKRRRSAQK